MFKDAIKSKNMEYKFDFDKECHDIRIRFNPSNYPLSTLLWLLEKEKFPYYISELLENRSFGVERASFNFYHLMDWEDKADFFKYFNREIEKDELFISFYDCEYHYSVMKVKDFEQIFHDYSSKILEVYSSEGILPITWVEKMSQALNQLKIKIELGD